MKDGRFFPADWLAIVFNPSFPYRLAHNVTAFYLTTGFMVLGVGAYLVRRGGFAEEGTAHGQNGARVPRHLRAAPVLPGRPPWSQHA